MCNGRYPSSWYHTLFFTALKLLCILSLDFLATMDLFALSIILPFLKMSFVGNPMDVILLN